MIAREYGFSSWPKLKSAIESGDAREPVTHSGSDDPLEVPLLPLRDYVVFPGMSMPLYVGRPKSFRAIEATSAEQQIFLVMQNDAEVDDPGADDIVEVGTLATVTQKVSSGNGLRILVRGERRARSVATDFSGDYAIARVHPFESTPGQRMSPREVAKSRSVFLKVVQAIGLPSELASALKAESDPGTLADIAAQHIPLGLAGRQALLQLADSRERLERAVSENNAMLEAIVRPPLDDFVGRYQLASGFVVSFAKGPDSLVAQSPWERVEVLPRGEDTFSRRVETAIDNDAETEPLSWRYGAPDLRSAIDSTATEPAMS